MPSPTGSSPWSWKPCGNNCITRIDFENHHIACAKFLQELSSELQLMRRAPASTCLPGENRTSLWSCLSTRLPPHGFGIANGAEREQQYRGLILVAFAESLHTTQNPPDAPLRFGRRLKCRYPAASKCCSAMNR